MWGADEREIHINNNVNDTTNRAPAETTHAVNVSPAFDEGREKTSRTHAVGESSAARPSQGGAAELGTGDESLEPHGDLGLSACSIEEFGDRVSTTFFPMDCRDGEVKLNNFSGDVSRKGLGEFTLASVWGAPLDVYRNRSHIASVSEEVYLVKVQTSGTGIVRHRGNEARLRPGDYTMCLSSEPYQLTFPEHFSQLVLAVPVDVLSGCVHDPSRFLGMRIAADDGVNGVFSQFVSSIYERVDTLGDVLLKRLEANVLDLLVTSIAHHEATESGSRREMKVEYLHRLKRYIDNHLCDPDLCPDSIATAHGITTRYLHMLFKSSDASLCRYIQSQRLSRCEAALKDPGFGARSVSDIAYHFGFNDASHFSRLFKSEYGEAPARYRRLQL